MKRFFIFLFLLGILTGCSYNQSPYQQFKNKTVFLDFDKKYFNKYKNKLNLEYQIRGGKKVSLSQGLDDYTEIILYPKPSLLYEYKNYYLNGKIQAYILKVGEDGLELISKYFDKTGTIIENIDYDKNYKFGFEKLLRKLKNEFQEINLYDYDDFNPFYNKTVIKRYDKTKYEDLKEKFLENDYFKNDLRRLSYFDESSFPMDIYEIFWISEYHRINYDETPFYYQNYLIINAQTGQNILSVGAKYLYGDE